MNAAKILRRTRLAARLAGGILRSMGRRKVFCVGWNKTGTSSMARAFEELGLVVGEQYLAERLLRDWSRRDFRRLFLYCRTAQAFQDVPFGLPFTFQALDQRFPGSKFILTIRDNPGQWYDSLTRFHARMFGHGRVPAMKDLETASYLRPGAAAEANRLIHNTPADDPYNREALIADYNAHNNAVREYFRHRPGALLVLNVAAPDAYRRLCEFLGKPGLDRPFPWVNRSSDAAGGPG